MTKTGKKLAAILLAVAMVITFIPVLGTQTAYAESNNFQLSDHISGLKDGKIVLGSEISFKPEDVIGSNDEMMEAYLEKGHLMIHSFGSTSESLDHLFEIDADGITRWTVPNYNGLLGDSFQIIFRFTPLEDENPIAFLSEEFKVCFDISIADVSGVEPKTYNGKAITQSPLVKFDGMTLISGTDYTLSYKNNVNAGTAAVVITGKENYAGSVEKTFKINKAANPLTIKAKTAKVKNKKLKKKNQKLVVTKVIKFTKKGQGKMNYTLSSAKKGKKSFKKYFKVNKKTGKVTIKKNSKMKKGTYKVKVKVRAAGNANYKASGTKTVTFKLKVK